MEPPTSSVVLIVLAVGSLHRGLALLRPPKARFAMYAPVEQLPAPEASPPPYAV